MLIFTPPQIFNFFKIRQKQTKDFGMRDILQKYIKYTK